MTADEIVRALAAMDPISEGETADLSCIFCEQPGAVTRTDIAGNEVRRGPVMHADSCIWTAACELIDGTLRLNEPGGSVEA